MSDITITLTPPFCIDPNEPSNAAEYDTLTETLRKGQNEHNVCVNAREGDTNWYWIPLEGMDVDYTEHAWQYWYEIPGMSSAVQEAYSELLEKEGGHVRVQIYSKGGTPQLCYKLIDTDIVGRRGLDIFDI